MEAILLYLIFALVLFFATVYQLSTLFKDLTPLRIFPYCVILLIGIQCVVFGALSFIGIGFNGILNALICVTVIAVCVLHKRRCGERTISHQEMRASALCSFLRSMGSREDLAAFSFNALFIVILALFQYGPELSLVFLSGDSASHCASMLNYASGSPVTGQFVFGLSGACIADATRYAIDIEHSYKCYIITEMLWCWLSMQMFYTLVSTVAAKLNILARMILCILFTFGYPFYSAVMGFGYYGASIAVMAAAFFTLVQMPLDKGVSLVALSIILTELSVTYLLFVPPTFFASFIVVWVMGKRTSKGAPQRLGTCVLTFLLPCTFALFLNYSGFFFSGANSTVSGSISALSSAITRDGGTLKTLFADFIFIAPLSLYGFAMKATDRERFIRLGVFPTVFTLYSMSLFFLCIFNIVSPYYFYKTYAILWLFFFVFAAIGIECLLKESKKLLISYACIWLMIFGLAITGLDAKLSEKRPNLDPSPISDQLFTLYAFNAETTKRPIFDERSLQQLREDAETFASEDQITALLGENETRWFRAFDFNGKTINWWDDMHHDIMLDTQTILDSIGGSEFVYIDDSFYSRPYLNSDYSSLDETVQSIIENYHVILETGYGTLYQLNAR